MRGKPAESHRGQARRQRGHERGRVHTREPFNARRTPRLSSRAAILRILERFDGHPGDLERIVDRHLVELNVDHRDSRFIFEISYGVVRRRLTLDYIIEHFLTDKKLMANREIMRILEMGAYQIIYLDKVPDHAAVNESVNLAKRSVRTEHLAGLVNAIMHAIIGARKNLPTPAATEDLAKRLSIEYSHPEWLVKRWLSSFGLSNTKKILAFNNEVPGVYLRRRLRGLSRQQFEVDARPIGEIAGGYNNLFYRVTASIAPADIALLRHGLCTVQAPSSGWIVALLDVKSGDRCLDLCSAPGGKATLMAELAGDEGSVVAAESKPARLERLSETIMRMNMRNIYQLACDSRFPPFRGQFTRVLLDAPCSGTGVMNRHPEARWTRTEEQVTRICEVQKELLEGSATLVAPGGVLVYATCSLEHEENEDRIAQFLASHPEFTIENPPAVVPEQYIGLDRCLHITPHEHKLDGAFGARLKRKGGA